MAKNTIKFNSYSNIQEEYTATAVAIYPGYLLELASATTVQAHSTAGGPVMPMVALEDELQGNDLNTVYAVSTIINCWIPTRGDKGYLVLADGENVSVGDFLESGGNGTVKKYTVDSETSADTATFYDHQIVAEVITAKDLSASGNTANGFVEVRFL
jgi:hypothetical protein